VTRKNNFEDYIDVIDNEIRKRRSKWRLDSITWMDYDDVSQILRSHIFAKWGQWDPDRPLIPWVNKIITNQLKNLIRNHYHSFAKPCHNCPFNADIHEEGNDTCSFTKSRLQDENCPLYKKWSKTKKHAFEIKMASSLENIKYEPSHLFSEISSSHFNLEFYIEKAHKLMEGSLNKKQYDIYKMLFIDNLEEEEVAIILGYKTNEKGRKAGYKQIKNLKLKYKKIFYKILESQKIFE